MKPLTLALFLSTFILGASAGEFGLHPHQRTYVLQLGILHISRSRPCHDHQHILTGLPGSLQLIPRQSPMLWQHSLHLRSHRPPPDQIALDLPALLECALKRNAHHACWSVPADSCEVSSGPQNHLFSTMKLLTLILFLSALIFGASAGQSSCLPVNAGTSPASAAHACFQARGCSHNRAATSQSSTHTEQTPCSLQF